MQRVFNSRVGRYQYYDPRTGQYFEETGFSSFRNDPFDNAGELTIDTDGELSVGIGGGLGIDSDGDLTLQIAPGISIDLGDSDPDPFGF